MKKSMKSARSSKVKKLPCRTFKFKAGELVTLMQEFEQWPMFGIVLEDYPKSGTGPHDSMVHILYVDGKDIWTPHVFLERI